MEVEMATQTGAYPVTFDVDYPDKPLNRLTSFFRIFTIIPIAIVLGLLAGGNSQAEASGWDWGYSSAALVVFPLVLMILFRQKYPRWWFDWNLALSRFSARVGAYFLLLRDEYPSTDEEQAVHLDLVYPDAAKDLNRWLPLVKWFLAIPHYFLLAFLFIGVIVCLVIAWFAILFTGNYPKGLFNYVVGVVRWDLRVMGYAFLQITDRYPPFSTEP